MSNYSVDLQRLTSVNNAHGFGKKLVFKNNDELNNSLTQIALGVFQPGESCEEHKHPTMFEYFYFLKGEGTYRVGGENIKIYNGLLVEIPAGVLHSLHNEGLDELRFLYWGIAI
ncbi:cupin domain-containing protein [Algoriphagus halophytocola]|uniref:cupin domain-containing protein n=1 Tax=Algoriphagus halophytocola TaxID=2991499 RepID=UPI0022DDCA23|nr:cupin domain-containing protein [Algoriphagus sp. TR-M9]WBL41233.1 cupin domain-containing protein [Algoriphagus sp. TR-M9]